MKMLHSCIRVFDLEKSVLFYKEALGLVETNRKDHSENGFILVYMSTEIGGFEIELTYNIGNEKYDIGNGYSHLALGVNDLMESYNKHKALGYELSTPKALNNGKPHFYFITDPDGYKIELIQL